MSNLVFVIEHCENCHMHSWNTRHDAKKYMDAALQSKQNILFFLNLNNL